MRRSQQHSVAIVFCTLSLIIIAASVATFRLLQVNATSDGLVNIRITADGPLTVDAGGSIRLTAEGDYGTMTMPVQADWSVGSGVPATVAHCIKTTQCEMTAGDDVGMVKIIADAEGYRSTIVLEITKALKNPFTDALPDWATPSIIHLYRAGIVKGYDDGRYGPADPVTRGQMITLLYRMLRSANLIAGGNTGCNAYTDVRPGDYMEEAVCAFAAKGWGFDESTFQPNDAASRGIVSKFVAIVGEPLLEKAGLSAESLADEPQVFDDVPRGNQFFTEVAIANALGVMTGYPSGDFGVMDPINRASIAVVMDRLLEQLNHAGLIQHAAAPISSQPSSSALSSVSIASSEPKPASASSSQDARMARTGFFSLIDWVNYYDFSTEENVPFPYDLPYDIRIAKPGPLADQTKVWVYKGDGWISRIDPALQRTYSNVRKDDCIRRLQETRRFDDPKIGAGDTVCIDTDDGYIVKMTQHWSGESMQYERWPGDIDYSAKSISSASSILQSSSVSSRVAVSSLSSVAISSSASSASSTSSASVVSSSSLSDDGFPSLPDVPSGALRGQGTITLSYQSWTTFDVDGEKTNAAVEDYDVMFPNRNATFEVDVASVYSQDLLKNVIRSKIMRSPTTYDKTTEENCLAVLRHAQGYSAIVPDYNGAVCFQTQSGLIGKLSSGWPYGNVRYEIWGGSWNFLPEYQPGAMPY